MPADLHIHTVYSDGALTPEEIVKQAHEAGLTTISITDHDSVDGLPAAIEEAKKYSLEVIPGMELSTELPGMEIHILGYFIDINDKNLLETLKGLQIGRETRIRKIVEKLDGLGLKINADRVLEIAGSGSAGRPHVAAVMIEKGYVDNIGEAFKKYLNFGGPGYVGHYKLTPKEAIELIKNSGGVSVLAHPGICKCDHLISKFISCGLGGIEVFYINHNEMQRKQYLYICQKNGLVVTGGSDFHGNSEMRNIKLGDVKVKDKYIIGLKGER